MAENSKIEWCDYTFNPWYGCTKIGPGCDHCYAEGWAKRSGLVQWGPGNPRRRSTPAYWRQPLKWNRDAKIMADAWNAVRALNPAYLTDEMLIAQGFRKPRRPRVFCASLADVFDSDVPAEWRADLFDLIAKTPHLDWLLVTKRIGNAERMVMDALQTLSLRTNQEPPTWPWANVWLGATICNQPEADRDIPKLLQTPAAVRFLSVEPLLGPVNLERGAFNREAAIKRAMNGPAACNRDQAEDSVGFPLDWVIVGGESGPNGRPMRPQWARDIRDQCEAAGVPFLFKQWGEWMPDDQNSRIDPPHDPAGAIRVGKKAAGRLLDGREHNDFPESPAK